MHLKNIISAFLVIAIIAGCSSNGGQDGGMTKEGVGTIAGAIGGAFIGSNVGKGSGRTLGIAAGTLLGAYIGNQVGSSLDRADMAYYNRTSQTALESNKSGATSTWHNPDSGHSGAITPTKTFKTAQGTYCREFSQTINIGGRSEDAFGKACRQNDGTWKIQ